LVGFAAELEPVPELDLDVAAAGLLDILPLPLMVMLPLILLVAEEVSVEVVLLAPPQSSDAN